MELLMCLIAEINYEGLKKQRMFSSNALSVWLFRYLLCNRAKASFFKRSTITSSSLLNKITSFTPFIWSECDLNILFFNLPGIINKPGKALRKIKLVYDFNKIRFTILYTYITLPSIKNVKFSFKKSRDDFVWIVCVCLLFMKLLPGLFIF